jgi:hypothetical protein
MSDTMIGEGFREVISQAEPVFRISLPRFPTFDVIQIKKNTLWRKGLFEASLLKRLIKERLQQILCRAHLDSENSKKFLIL